MKKDRGADANRPYRLAHQTLCITGINFETESLVGYVEMQIYPLKQDLRRVKINSKQCCIYRVSVNEVWEASFSYNDPALEICQGDGKQRNLEFFERCHISAMKSVDPDMDNGELTIKIPSEAYPLLQELRPFRICIEFSLERPKGGLKFVVADIDGTMLERGAHLFTCKQDNSSRLWFPCIDSYSEVCTWKMEYTVDMYLTAVSCGDLIETVYTTDLRKKTYHYYLSTPTAAPNIGLAVGPFEVYVDPHMHEVTHFCLPHLLPLLKQSVSLVHEAFEFYEELLSSRYPYSCYKEVFVDQAYNESVVYATMSVFNTNLLHSKKIIDQVPDSRQAMAAAIAQQFFGCFISMQCWVDAWLPKGIAGYLATLYKRRMFGNNEYRHFICQEMKIVQEYEQQMGLIYLDPSAGKDRHYFSIRQPHAISSQYYCMFEKKSHLILRMLEIRIGRELLLQVLNKLLSLAINASQQKFTSHNWGNMMLSTSSFLKCISTVTGKDLHTFMEQWVVEGGFAKFIGSFVFNRKRNIVELELKQDWTCKGALKYVGPLSVAIQELDGTFNHNFKIEENKTKFEITCHSKSRRHKKKKIPLSTGEEIDMDLGDTDADSPVLWLRIDPEMTLYRHITLEQPDWMWQYMLRYERCIVAQGEAISRLLLFPTPKTRMALTDTIENEKSFYRVRIDAAMHLTKVANSMVGTWAGPPAMVNIFRKMFGCHSSPSIVKRNNFSNFQNYHIQKIIPLAMAQLRTIHGICPTDVLHFILDLIKYNDNCKNRYSDNYYRAALLDALTATVTPAVNTVTITGMGPSTDALTEETKLILEELTRCLNLEKLLPCYKFTVTVSCIKTIRHLQKFGHLPIDSSLFKKYASAGTFSEVRLAALNALVDFTKVEGCRESLDWLLHLVETDQDPYLRHSLLQMLIQNPPFTRTSSSSLSNEALVERLWLLMNSTFAHDSRLRCDVTDLYYTLYGRVRPACLPIPDSLIVLNLKERRAITSHSIDDDWSSQNYSMSPLSSSKRYPDSPPDSYLPEAKEPRLMDTDEGSQFKLKIKFGGKSSEEPSSETSTFSHPQVHSPPQSYTSFNAEFSKYVNKIPSPTSAPTLIFSPEKDSPDGDPASREVPIGLDMTGVTPVVRDPSPSRLSLSSAGSYIPPVIHTEEVVEEEVISMSDIAMETEVVSHDITTGPDLPGYSFNDNTTVQSDYSTTVQMDYSQHTDYPSISQHEYSSSVQMDFIPPTQTEYYPPVQMDPPPPVGVARPMDMHIGLQRADTTGSTLVEPPPGSELSGRSSKGKKKKKKNKHKHKHKHKHDRERDRPSDVISSEASTHNSPAFLSQQSSPEFEVI